MDASRRGRALSAAGPLLLAAAVLGGADALTAIWYAAGIAPERTLPLCSTVPFAIALLVLGPPAGLHWIAASCATRLGVAREATPASRTAALLGVAGALAVPHLADGLAVPLASAAFVACRRLALAGLRCMPATRFGRLVVAAALLHAAALAGAAWQWRREGRGLEGDLLAMLTGATVASIARGPHAGGAVTTGAPPANLVLVTIDTLRADHLDDTRMPRTAALARDGTHFTQAFASSSWTLPALASLMTGLPAARHGAGAPRGADPLSRAPLDPARTTLATRLRAAGFATRAVVTNPYLGLGYGLGAGFDAYENVTLESETVLTLEPTTGFRTLARVAPALVVDDRGDAVTARAARFLRSRPSGRFFLWLHYLDPHAPYDGATRSFRDELLAGGGVTTRLPRMAQLRAGEIRPDTAGRAEMRTAYARAVRFADDQVGRIVDLLEETGLAPGTLLVVTADHGEELWDRGGVEHGHTLHDEVVRVPLVLRCHGCVPRGARIDVPVGIAALAPTLLDLLGVARSGAHADDDAAALAAANGFAPLLRGEAWLPVPVVSENLLFAEDRIALRTARHTYVTWPTGKEEIYDRARDPRELRDLAAREPLLRRHRALLAAARDAWPAATVGAPTVGVSAGGVSSDAASTDGASAGGASASDGASATGARLRRSLAALGYVE